MIMTDYINLYERYLLETKHSSVNTVASYIRDLRQFDKYVSENLDCSLDEVTPEQATVYFAWQTNA